MAVEEEDMEEENSEPRSLHHLETTTAGATTVSQRKEKR